MNTRLPTEPGFYWGQWRRATDDTPNGDELVPSFTWKPHEVFLNVLDKKDPKYLMVSVHGVEEPQMLEDFFWGASPMPIKPPRDY